MSEQIACKASDLEPGTALRADLKTAAGRVHPVAVVRADDGDVYAIDDTCTHADVSLSEGDIDGCEIECWAHGSRFDLRTGEPNELPAVTPVRHLRRSRRRRRHPDRRRRAHHPRQGERMSTLDIRGLKVSVDTKEGTKPILRGVDLTIESGKTHAIMGPNGSGKSTLAYSLAGHPKYTVTDGTVTLDGEDVLAMTVDERARAGLFLAMQYPIEVPGVSVSNFLRTAKTAIDGEAPKLRTWVKDVKDAMANLKMDPEFAERNVNEGFSGGEKKRHEILQMELLQPKFADPRRDGFRARHRRPPRRE